MKKKSVFRLALLGVSLAVLVSFAGCELTGTGSFDGADSRRGGPPAKVNQPAQPYGGEEFSGTVSFDSLDIEIRDGVLVIPDGDILGYQSFSYGLWAGQNIEAGTVVISNDEDAFYIYIETYAALKDVHIDVYTDASNLPSTRPIPGQAAYKAEGIGEESYLMVVPFSDLGIILPEDGDVFVFSIHVSLMEGSDPAFNYLAGETAYAAGHDTPSFAGTGAWFYLVGYVVTEVPLPDENVDAAINAGDFRTQTQGGWGTSASGNNPGVYRDANFAAAFPEGLVIGGGFTVTLTSSAAVQAFLPEGGSPAVLTRDYVDESVGSVFAGQVAALALSVGFDNYDPNFGASPVKLAELVFVSGIFEGWTVGELLAEANLLLGGGTSSFTAAQLSDGAASVNENFVDGTIVADEHLLRLP